MAFKASELDVREKTVLWCVTHESLRFCICYSLSSIYCEEENSRFRVPLILPSCLPPSGRAEDWKAFLDCCFGHFVPRQGLQVFPKFTGGGNKAARRIRQSPRHEPPREPIIQPELSLSAVEPPPEFQAIKIMFESLKTNLSDLLSRLNIARVLYIEADNSQYQSLAETIKTWILDNDDSDPNDPLKQTRTWLEHLELPIQSMQTLASNIQHITIVALTDAKLDDAATEKLCEALGHANNLIALYLIDNRIGPSGVIAIAKRKESWKKLETLILNDPKSASIGPNASALFELPQTEPRLNRYRPSYLDSLKTVCVGGHLIGDEGVQSIVRAFPIMKKLETLYLYGNGITDKGAVVLTQNIHLAVNLTFLSMRENHMSFDMENTLKKTLADCVSKRKQMSSRSCSCLSPGGIRSQGWSIDVSDPAEAVFATLKQNPSDLQSRLVYASGMRMIAQRRDALDALQLDIWIHEHSRSRPADVLEQSNIVLTQLSLRGTLMRPLAFAVHEMRNLTFLTLRYADLDGQATEMLCEGLKHTVLLHTLDLSHNSIGLGGAEAIGRMKTTWVRLSVLDLSHPKSDPFMFSGARALLEPPNDENQAARDGHPPKSYLNSLSRLSLDGQQIGDEGVRFLVGKFGILKKIATISLTQNDITENEADALIQNISDMTRTRVLTMQPKMGSNTEARLQQALNTHLTSRREDSGAQLESKRQLELGLRDRECKLREIQEQMEHLKAKAKSKKTDLLALKDEITRSRDQHDAKNQDYLRLSSGLTDIQKRLDEKATELQNFKDPRVQALEKEVDDIKRQIEDTKGQLATHNTMARTLQREVDTKKVELNTRKSEVDGAKAKKKKQKNQDDALEWQKEKQEWIISGGSGREIVRTQDKHTICSICFDKGIGTPCHQSCSLPYMETIGDFGFRSCACMDNGICKVCPNKCGIETHVHVYWLPR